MMRIIMIISITALAWSRYEINLYKEQNQNLADLVQNLEDEAKDCSNKVKTLNKALEYKAPTLCTPCIIKSPDIVYTSDSCDPCRCTEDE